MSEKSYSIPTAAAPLDSTTFSAFGLGGGGILETKPSAEWSLRQLIEATKTGTIPGSNLDLAEMVARVRSCNAKEEAGKAKAALPYCVPTGHFGKRGDEGWERSSGLLVLDRDSEKDRALTEAETNVIVQTFAKLPWACNIFRGPSGCGAKAILHAPFLAEAKSLEEAKEDLKLAHQAVCHYIAHHFPNLAGHQDSCGEKLSQAHYLSFDPDSVDRTAEAEPLTWAFVEEWANDRLSEAEKVEKAVARKPSGERAGDAYNALDDVKERTLQVLLKAGWSIDREIGQSYRLCRPGKSGGASATLWPSGALKVFTTADADLSEDRHSPFHVFATLEHGGDHKAAARAVAQELGLSSPTPPPRAKQGSSGEGGDAAEVPEAYFHNADSKFYIPNDRGNGREVFVAYSRGELERILKSTYESMKPVVAENRVVDDPAKRYLTEAARDRCFEAVLALPRREPGLETLPDGSRVLIPRGLDLPTPERGEYPFIEQVLRAALGEEQYRWLWWWLASSLQGLYAGKWVPSPVVVLVGPGNSFKSFLQNFIITPAMGGRSADPMKFMAGDTSFNGDLAEAVHLCISDQRGGDIRQRRSMKEFFKSAANDETHDIHAKGKQALRIPTHWRMTVSCNPEDDSLNALPDLDESSEGKIAFLKMDLTDWENLPEAAKATGGEANEERQRIVQEELPRMVGAMLAAGEVPEELRERIPGRRDSGRYAINAFHHPEIVQLLLQKRSLDSIRGRPGTAAEVLNAFREANPSFSYGKAGPFAKRLKALARERPDLVHYEWDQRRNGGVYIVDPQRNAAVVPFTAEALK
jgi:hypothetical protein